jgi:hypothetical protein
MSYLVTYIITVALTAGCVWGVARWAGFSVPTVDLLFITGLCSGIALAPVWAGWVLAMIILSLLVVKTTQADAWPDAVLMATGCGLIWIVGFSARMVLTA